MVNLLESIIDGATEDAVSTSNLLRKIVVVSHRIQSTETLAWAESEIAGYDTESPDKLPEYRGPLKVPVSGTYTGPMGSSATQVLSDYGVPEDYVSALFHVRSFQPLAEPEGMARNRDANLGVPWPAAVVTKWNGWGREGVVQAVVQVPGFTGGERLPRPGAPLLLVPPAELERHSIRHGDGAVVGEGRCGLWRPVPGEVRPQRPGDRRRRRRGGSTDPQPAGAVGAQHAVVVPQQLRQPVRVGGRDRTGRTVQQRPYGQQVLDQRDGPAARMHLPGSALSPSGR